VVYHAPATFPMDAEGCQVVEVEVDADTGEVRASGQRRSLTPITRQDSATKRTGLAQAVTLGRSSSSTCAWRCESLFSNPGIRLIP